MDQVLKYLLDSNQPLVKEADLTRIPRFDKYEWNDYVDEVRGMIVTKPGMVRNVVVEC